MLVSIHPSILTPRDVGILPSIHPSIPLAHSDVKSFLVRFCCNDHDGMYWKKKNERTNEQLLRLQGPYRMFWDRGDVLLDAIASYFGECASE